MATENAPGNGTSDQGLPVENGGQEFDYRQGYEQLRPEFTRATQELSQKSQALSEYEQLFDALHDDDEEVRQQALAALGVELPAGSPESNAAAEEFVDPLEQEIAQLREQVQSLSSAREQEDAAKEEQRILDLRDEYIGEGITFIEDEQKKTNASFKFSEAEEKALGNLAIAMTDSEGMPDVQGAYQLLYGEEGVLELNRSRWIDTKRGAAQAPFGRSIPTEQKPKNAAERVAYIDQRMQERESQF